MIIGRDLIKALKLNLNFEDDTITWNYATVRMKNIDVETPESHAIDDSPSMQSATNRIKRILDAKYEAADIKQEVAKCTHLNTKEKEKLETLLTKYEKLFDGTLGHWTNEEYDIEVREGAQPYHARAYPVPKTYEATLKLEVERLCAAGVLKKVNRSEWAAPTFIIPKKDGTVHFISDFRELNKRIKRKPFPIPKIQDLMQKLEGFQYGTSLDLNMGYYHIELSPASKKIMYHCLALGQV